MLPNQQAKSLGQIAEEFAHDIMPGELMDVLEAIRTLKRGSGWGMTSMTYLNSELDTIEINIKRKPKKKKPL